MTDFHAALEQFDKAFWLKIESRQNALYAIQNAPDDYQLDERAQALYDVWALLEAELQGNDSPNGDYNDVLCIAQTEIEKRFINHVSHVPGAVTLTTPPPPDPNGLPF